MFVFIHSCLFVLPEVDQNGTEASPAAAFANKVFPVPVCF